MTSMVGIHPHLIKIIIITPYYDNLMLDYHNMTLRITPGIDILIAPQTQIKSGGLDLCWDHSDPNSDQIRIILRFIKIMQLHPILLS